MTPRKIVVIGPESTGKSTLSAALAEALGTVWVPEYARSYLEVLGRQYEEGDLLEMAFGQLALEEQLSAQAGPFLICDTDLYVFKVWSEAKYGRCHRRILESLASCQPHLYLLTDTDTHWEEDPLREHPSPEDRRYFYHQYRDIVMHSGVAWADIRGVHEARMATALAAIAQSV